MEHMDGASPNIEPAVVAFARLTGRYPADGKAVYALPDDQSAVFHALMIEQLAPVRVIWGYHGYAGEFGLRDGLSRFLERLHPDWKIIGIRRAAPASCLQSICISLKSPAHEGRFQSG